MFVPHGAEDAKLGEGRLAPDDAQKAFVFVGLQTMAGDEFRVFQGTPNWEAVLSYIEYVDALTEWTRNPANPMVGPVGQALFRAWVCVTGDYPALATRFTTTQTREVLACVLPLLSRAA